MLTIFRDKKKTITKRYSNYGQKVEFKRVYSYTVPGKLWKKVIYTPWLPSEEECNEYLSKFKQQHGIDENSQITKRDIHFEQDEYRNPVKERLMRNNQKKNR
jgi:hypothetical protein